jgi:hypothetical protein
MAVKQQLIMPPPLFLAFGLLERGLLMPSRDRTVGVGRSAWIHPIQPAGGNETRDNLGQM